MIIDFHTHIFPDALAEKAISNLQKSGNIKSSIGGRASDLLAEMDNSGVNLSVILPILTAPKHFETMTAFAEKVNRDNKRLLSFAAVHPVCENIDDKLKYLKELGFVGVKLHPLFQNFDIDSIASERLIGKLCEYDFIVSIHAGYDISFPNAVNAVPDKLFNMIKAVRPTKTILAHMGAADYWQESLEILAPLDVYFDTSFSLDEMSEELFLNLIKAKGENKVLFGTDSPWKSQKAYVESFNNLPLSQDIKDKILFKNAQALLGVN